MVYNDAGIIIGIGSPNDRWRYNVVSSFIDRDHTQNDHGDDLPNHSDAML